MVQYPINAAQVGKKDDIVLPMATNEVAQNQSHRATSNGNSMSATKCVLVVICVLIISFSAITSTYCYMQNRRMGHELEDLKHALEILGNINEESAMVDEPMMEFMQSEEFIEIDEQISKSSDDEEGEVVVDMESTSEEVPTEKGKHGQRPFKRRPGHKARRPHGHGRKR